MEWLSTYNLTEVHDTRQENFAAPTPTASVRLKVKYSERYNAIRDLLSTPVTYPFSNDICASGYVLYCTEARLAQNPSAYTSDDGQVIDYNDYSFIDATYTLQTGYYRAPGSTSNNEYVEETLEPRMETLPLNNNLYYWAGSDGSASVGENDPLATDESPVRYEPGVTYTKMIKGLPTFDLDWLDFQGTVHNSSLTSVLLGITFPANTLLLRSMTTVREWSHLSYILCYPTWTVTYKYEYKKQTWNKFWRGGVNPPGYFNIRLRSTGDIFEPFSELDHSTLLGT